MNAAIALLYIICMMYSGLHQRQGRTTSVCSALVWTYIHSSAVHLCTLSETYCLFCIGTMPIGNTHYRPMTSTTWHQFSVKHDTLSGV